MGPASCGTLGPMHRVLVVGAGLSGSTVARELVERLDCEVSVIESRDHIGGNCYSYEHTTGIEVHAFGPHILHSDDDLVWNYFQKFVDLDSYTHKVAAVTSSGESYPFPVNLTTLNSFFNSTWDSSEARLALEQLAMPIASPRNFEEAAHASVGIELYEAFFQGYTRKQWGVDPVELPPEVFGRIPLRFDNNDSYHRSRYTAIPRQGYTALFASLLDHPRITVRLAQPFDRAMVKHFDHVVFTGAIDSFFGYSAGRLGYRTVFWNHAVHAGDFQGRSQVNFTSVDVPHTRTIEHKHFQPNRKRDLTIVSTEFSKETTEADEPFYPKRLAGDKSVLKEYVRLAAGFPTVSFVGRLATYRYLDMWRAVKEARSFAARLTSSAPGARPRFSESPI